MINRVDFIGGRVAVQRLLVTAEMTDGVFIDPFEQAAIAVISMARKSTKI